MDSLEIITSPFMAIEKRHDELRSKVQAISEPSFLVLVKDAAIELPGDSTSQRTISDTASRCLEYVQSHGKPALDLALQDRNYGRALSVIKGEDMEYCQMEYGSFQHDIKTSSNLLAAKRILAKLRNIWTGDVPFISVQLVGTNIDKLLASIEGPPDTPYAGGVFWITVHMPTEDPLRNSSS
jgi:Ubiquitin-conjugating enzyme